MGLTSQHWLTIAIFLLTAILGVVGFLLRRFLARVDEHHAALYGRNQQGGLLADVALFKTRAEEHHATLAELSITYCRREDQAIVNAEAVAHIDKIRIEANQREGRLLEAIREVGTHTREDNRVLRQELSKTNERIDRLRDMVRIR